jgi:hypothetical protein
MATDPQFAATVNLGAALLGAAETNLQVPTVTSVVFTAGSSGSKIEEVIVEATATSLTPTTVAGIVYLFLYDGTNYRLFDTVTIAAITASATVPGFRVRNTYGTLVLKSGWSLRASQSTSGNASILTVLAFGGDL